MQQYKLICHGCGKKLIIPYHSTLPDSEEAMAFIRKLALESAEQEGCKVTSEGEIICPACCVRRVDGCSWAPVFEW